MSRELLLLLVIFSSALLVKLQDQDNVVELRCSCPSRHRTFEPNLTIVENPYEGSDVVVIPGTNYAYYHRERLGGGNRIAELHVSGFMDVYYNGTVSGIQRVFKVSYSSDDLPPIANAPGTGLGYGSMVDVASNTSTHDQAIPGPVVVYAGEDNDLIVQFEKKTLISTKNYARLDYAFEAAYSF